MSQKTVTPKIVTRKIINPLQGAKSVNDDANLVEQLEADIKKKVQSEIEEKYSNELASKESKIKELIKNGSNINTLQNHFVQLIEEGKILEADQIVDTVIANIAKSNFVLGVLLSIMNVNEKYKELINPLTNKKFQEFQEYYESKELKKTMAYREMAAAQTSLALADYNIEKAAHLYDKIGKSKLELIGKFVFNKETEKRSDYNAIKKHYLNFDFLVDISYDNLVKEIKDLRFQPSSEQGSFSKSIVKKVNNFLFKNWFGGTTDRIETDQYVIIRKTK